MVDKGFGRVVKLLVERGADLQIANRRGQTPRAVAARGRTGNVEAAPATVALLDALTALRESALQDGAAVGREVPTPSGRR